MFLTLRMVARPGIASVTFSSSGKKPHTVFSLLSPQTNTTLDCFRKSVLSENLNNKKSCDFGGGIALRAPA